ncbi:MAG TPA: branched-chain amino acid ABC transporter permease [Methylomirabilota bacterium]|nr:branched-chain amino acid ABC transporter permease [Methylomirabilota bacterium]
MIAIAQQLVLGVLLGALYGLAAAGLSLVFGVLRVLNVAHGELIMLGGYGAFWLFELGGLDPFLGLAAVIPLAGALGAGLYLGLFRAIVRFDEETRVRTSLLVGFGLALTLHALAVRLFTADERAITTSYASRPLVIGGLVVPLGRFLSLLVAVGLVALLHAFLQRNRWGQAIRAAAEDWEAALLVGIDVRRAYLLAFGLGTALAGAAGTLVAAGYSISPAVGLEWTLKALIVIVLAGLGSAFGTLLGGLVLGCAEALSAASLGGAYREVVGLLLFFCVLVARPQGLFGRA